METIDQLSNKFLQEAKKKELQEFCEKQYRELLRILEINKVLEEENKHLKKLVIQNDSFIIDTGKASPEELICLEQIALLKEVSKTNALTLEEARKLDTYVKLIRLIKGKDKADEVLKGFKTEDLMKLVEDGK